jgi:hypothetical protein
VAKKAHSVMLHSPMHSTTNNSSSSSSKHLTAAAAEKLPVAVVIAEVVQQAKPAAVQPTAGTTSSLFSQSSLQDDFLQSDLGTCVPYHRYHICYSGCHHCVCKLMQALLILALSEPSSACT